MTDMYVQKANENSFFCKNMTFKKNIYLLHLLVGMDTTSKFLD